MTTPRSERRKYYRINDDVLLHYRVDVSSDDDASPGVQLEVATGAILAEIDRELNHTINRIWARDPDVGRALGLLNRKISVLGSLTAPTESGAESVSYQRTTVNLSGSGIAFEATERLPEGTAVIIEIGLLPSQSSLRLQGRVVASPEAVTNGSGYWTRVEFDEDLDQQEELIRHVVQKQGMLLADNR
ncbi:MAG: PilZ domain-containing protein [Haliea sp.]|uniref:PilZ domain-containing protein n=1 Tax=Haliea sp. TaxID=1932666 RepID=UPI0032EB58B7